VSVTSASLVEHVSTRPHCLLEASVDASSDQTPAPDEQRASGEELQPRALPPECGRQRGADAVVVRVEERID